MSNYSERIRAIAPGSAALYRMKMQLSDGNVRVFPPEEGAFYRISESPYHVPAGSYLLCFYDNEERPIPGHDQTFVVQVASDTLRTPQAQLPLNFQLVGSTAASAAASSPALAYTAAKTPASAAAPQAAPPAKPKDEAADTADLEFRKHLHAMDMEERQQDFIRNSTYIKEVGELFMLNRLMRRDMMEMQRSMVLHSQQAFRDIEQMKATFQGLIAIQNTVLDHVEKRQSFPPPPPPDYVGLGHSAIALLKEVSVALIQRGQPERAPAAQSAPQQLLAVGATAPTPITTTEVVRQPDAVERIGKKLKTLTEFELAQAMSSPEAWSALLQSCMAPASTQEGAAKESASSPAHGSGG